MAGRIKFDQEAAFKSIIGVEKEQEEIKVAEKNNSKAQNKTKKRVSLALYPENYKNLQKIAYVDRQSASSIIDILIENYVANNAAKLEEYSKIKPE